MTVIIITAACAATAALFAAAVFYGTRDTGQRGTGRRTGGARGQSADLGKRETHFAFPQVTRRASKVPGQALTWASAAIRARLARIPPAENPDPAQVTPFERPLTDWLRDSVVMEAIRITKEGQ